MTERLSNYELDVWTSDRWYNPATQENAPTVTALLAREVQASRKLVADLLALHRQHAPVAHFGFPYCRACQHPYPCPTVQLIEASGCSAVTP